MNSKRPPGPADGDRASDADDESIDDSLNQILAESEAGTGVAATTRPGADEEVTADVAIEADSLEPAEAVAPAADEPAPTDEIRALAVPAPDSPEAAASMSGPALVDDAKEEHTDVESPESMAAAAAEAEKALAASDAAPDLAGTPVREALAANLAKASVRQEEIITASGGGRPGEEVITAENAGFFAEPKNAPPTIEDSEGTKSLGPSVGARGEPSLAEQSREERERGLRRSRPPTPVTPLPRMRDRVGGGGLEGDGSLEPELEVGALDYGRQRSSSPPADDGHGARRSGVEPRLSGYGGEGSNARVTPPHYPSSGPGSGRHSLPPPSPRVTPPSGRGRLPTPKPGVAVSVTPSPRISSTGIPISTAAGSSGPMPVLRGSPSAVFSKVQLPLGGLVTVVGAAFGVGLIIGAVLWRGSAEPASEAGGHATAEGKATPTPAAAEPTPTPPPAPVAAASAPAAPPPPSEPVAAPAPPPAPAVSASAIAPGGQAAEAAQAAASSPSVNAKESSKKVASAMLKPARTKKTATAPTTNKADAPAKTKGATWVDPFAQ